MLNRNIQLKKKNQTFKAPDKALFSTKKYQYYSYFGTKPYTVLIRL